MQLHFEGIGPIVLFSVIIENIKREATRFNSVNSKKNLPYNQKNCAVQMKKNVKSPFKNWIFSLHSNWSQKVDLNFLLFGSIEIYRRHIQFRIYSNIFNYSCIKPFLGTFSNQSCTLVGVTHSILAGSN